MKLKVLLIFLGVAAFVGVLFYSSLGGDRVRVEVCVTYGGRQECRTARGADEREARQTAQQNACAVLARGMTDSMACQESRPDRVRTLD